MLVCTLNDGGTYLVENDQDAVVELITVNYTMGGYRPYLLPKGRFDLERRGPCTPLPYDTRKWKPEYRWAWLQDKLRKQTQHVPYIHSLSRTAAQWKDLQQACSLEKIYWNYAQVMVQVRGAMGRASGEPEPPKPLRSRRVKQKQARQRRVSLGLLVTGTPQSAPRALRTTATYPTRPNRWPLVNVSRSVGEWMARIGARNSEGIKFMQWYEQEGRFLDCHPADYYRIWLGVGPKVDLNVAEEEPGKFYLVHPRAEDGPHAPKPPDWPFTYLGRLGTTEEMTALAGILIHDETFLTWYDRELSLSYCRRHQAGDSFNGCRGCAQAAYRRWYKQARS